MGKKPETYDRDPQPFSNNCTIERVECFEQAPYLKAQKYFLPAWKVG